MKEKRTKDKIIIILAVVLLGIIIGGVVYSGVSMNKAVKEGSIEIKVDNRTIKVSVDDYKRWQEEQAKIEATFTGSPENLSGYIETAKRDFFSDYILTVDTDISKLSNLDTGRLNGIYLYEKIKESGTKKQKEQIDKYVDGAFFYPRKILVMTGDVKEEASRITLKEAEEICSELSLDKEHTSVDDNEFYISTRFNRIAVVCDLDGGSGIYRREYWMDPEGNELIRIMLGSVTYVKNGKEVKTLYKI